MQLTGLAKCDLLAKAYWFYCERRFWISLQIARLPLTSLKFVVARAGTPNTLQLAWNDAVPGECLRGCCLPYKWCCQSNGKQKRNTAFPPHFVRASSLLQGAVWGGTEAMQRTALNLGSTRVQTGSNAPGLPPLLFIHMILSHPCLPLRVRL